eukprot:8984793-Alexandrium_andersonii.AAC.1
MALEAHELATACAINHTQRSDCEVVPSNGLASARGHLGQALVTGRPVNELEADAFILTTANSSARHPTTAGGSWERLDGAGSRLFQESSKAEQLQGVTRAREDAIVVRGVSEVLRSGVAQHQLELRTACRIAQLLLAQSL